MGNSYKSHEAELDMIGFWEESGFSITDFQGENNYCITLPPPNITGGLHLGHALNATIQDFLIRYNRVILEKNVLFLPGADHAGIAAEYVLRSSNPDFDSLSGADFNRSMMLLKDSSIYGIKSFFRRFGCFFPPNIFRFTMDSNYSKSVLEAFKRLYLSDLIYCNSECLVNRCVHCGTSLSDLEVVWKEEEGELYNIKYSIVGSDPLSFVEVSTTRPETLFGDSAIAVNPNDDRFKNMVGSFVKVPIIGTVIPIIGDKAVDPDYGTGVLKVTPGHDFVDMEIAGRHDLSIHNIITSCGIIQTGMDTQYEGMSVLDARRTMIKDEDCISFSTTIKHRVGHCYRCDSIVEPLCSKQWFVKVAPLMEPVEKAIRDGSVRFFPSAYINRYRDWISSDIKDWCISRQIRWGHRIPMSYCDSCGYFFNNGNTSLLCPACGSLAEPVTDVLDTWFSSSLWPFAALGWPDLSSSTYKNYFPTDVVVTGGDILFFWVVRMMFMSFFLTGRAPFKDVVIHPIIKASDGEKMSKTLHNGVDPLSVVEEHGADSLRLYFSSSNRGRDFLWDDSFYTRSRALINKLWNAVRFVIMTTEDIVPLGDVTPSTPFEEWIYNEVNRALHSYIELAAVYDISGAVHVIRECFWRMFCGRFIGFARVLTSMPDVDSVSVKGTLVRCISMFLKMFHPVIPYATEIFWGKLYGDLSIMSSPMVSEFSAFGSLESSCQAVEFFNLVIDHIRSFRGEFSYKRDLLAVVFDLSTVDKYLVERYVGVVESICNIKVTFGSVPNNSISSCGGSVGIILPESLDRKHEINRLKSLIGVVSDPDRVKLYTSWASVLESDG
ncbi:MAG: valine--tRNA ligase [bacterium]|nr:valine--tRNA ligase [bacterium]